MSKEPQSFKNHARFHPPFHFFLSFVLIANVVFAVFHLIHHWQFERFSSLGTSSSPWPHSLRFSSFARIR